MSIFKPETELCPVCGKDSRLYRMPFETIPNLSICSDCCGKAWLRAGCGEHVEGCCSCDLCNAANECERESFDLTLIGYDPEVVYRKPEQLALFGNQKGEK